MNEKTHCTVQWYGYTFKNDTVEALKHVPDRFVSRYSMRVSKRTTSATAWDEKKPNLTIKDSQTAPSNGAQTSFATQWYLVQDDVKLLAKSAISVNPSLKFTFDTQPLSGGMTQNRNKDRLFITLTGMKKSVQLVAAQRPKNAKIQPHALDRLSSRKKLSSSTAQAGANVRDDLKLPRASADTADQQSCRRFSELRRAYRAVG